MMPPSLSHYFLEGEDRGRDEEVAKYCRDGLLGYRDNNKVRVSHVWEEREGRTSSMASAICVDKDM